MHATNSNPAIKKNFDKLSLITCALTAIISTAVMLGWLFNIPWLKNAIPYSISMVFNTALCFLFLSMGGIAALKRKEHWQKTHRVILTLTGLVVFVISCVTLLSFFVSLGFDVNNILYKTTVLEPFSKSPGQMAPNTAINFLLLSISLLLLASENTRLIYISQCLVLLTLLISLSNLLGYIHKVEYLYGYFTFTRMSLYTAISFVFISFGMLLAYINEGPLFVVTSNKFSGKIARRLIIALIFLPFLVMTINRFSESYGIYSGSFGDILVVIINIVGFGSILLWVLTSLDKSEKEFGLLFNLSVDMICIADMNGYFKKVNPAFSKILGWTEHDLLKKPYSEFIHQDDINATHRVEERLVSGKNILSFYNRYQCKDGTYKWISWSAVPVLDEGIIFAVGRDITQIKELENKLKQANEHLLQKNKEAIELALEMQSASKAKTEFLSNMSHELRTPLNAIIGFSDIMLRGMTGSVNDNQKEYLSYINSGGNHLLNLINDLLDLSKIESGKMELQLMEFDLNKVINDSLLLFKEKITQHQFTIRVNGEKKPIIIYADELKIKQVILNLLSNAFKFTPNKGMITLNTSILSDNAHQPLVSVEVIDSGIGISEQDQERLFKPFVQLETSYQKKYGGTGLGLSLCKNIVELHHGTIFIKSKIDQGSTFTFIIPKTFLNQ